MLNLNYEHPNLTGGSVFISVLRDLERHQCDQYLNGEVDKLRQGWHDNLIIASYDHGIDSDNVESVLLECKQAYLCDKISQDVGTLAFHRLNWRIKDITRRSNFHRLEWSILKSWFEY